MSYEHYCVWCNRSSHVASAKCRETWKSHPDQTSPMKWTDELEAARMELCEFWIGIADNPRTLPEVARRAVETEQALTILGEIAKTTALEAP